MSHSNDELVLCTIGVRGGSQGLPGKNARLLCGKPLLAHTVEHALNCGLFHRVVVSTDCDELMHIARKAGAEVFFKREAIHAGSTSPKIPVMRDCLLRSEEYFNESYPSIIDLDATSPLRLPEDILGAYKTFLKGGYSNLITGAKARRSPYFNLVEIKEDGRVDVVKKACEYLNRRQDAPICYDMNASIYIWKRERLLNTNELFHEDTGFYEMPESRSIDIDSELDFKIVEMILKDRGND